MCAELAALATLKQLTVEHGEAFMLSAIAGVLTSRCLQPRAVGALGGRPCLTRAQAVAVVRAIHANIPNREKP